MKQNSEFFPVSRPKTSFSARSCAYFQIMRSLLQKNPLAQNRRILEGPSFGQEEIEGVPRLDASPCADIHEIFKQKNYL